MTSTIPTTPLPSAPQKWDPAPLFDTIGAKYAVAFADLQPQQQSLTWLLSTLPNPTTHGPSLILDIGSGTGQPVASTLSQAGHTVHGLDISREMITVARRDVPGAVFIHADIQDWSPAPDTPRYDAVTAYFSLLAGFTQSGLRSILTRMASWVRPGGLLVLATLPGDLESVKVEWLGLEGVISSLTREEILGLLQGAGVEVVREEMSRFRPRGVEAGICEREEQVWEEEHLFVWGRKVGGEV